MPSVSSIAAQTLQRRITSGEFAQGQTLPSQRELADCLGISRASLREAISTLEALGMVRSQAGKGVFVTWGANPAPVRAALGHVSYTPLALFEFRFAVEPAWTALAARRVSPAMQDELAEIQAQMEAALHGGNLVVASECDLQFHLRLAECCGNVPLESVAHQFREQIAHCLRLPFAKPGSVWAPADEHRAILAAISAADGKAARSAMHAHLLGAARRVGIADEIETL